MKKIYTIGIGMILSIASINAQSIKNINASASGSKVVITYDLIGSDTDQKFDIIIKSSSDNFSDTLKEVVGDVGTNQSAGNGKKITWDAGKELRVFKGDISFEITATVTFTPLKFVKPATSTGIKIGKSYTMKWVGGTQNKNLTLELLKNNSQVIDMGDVKNTGSYTWNVPKTMEKGEGFQFKLLDPTKPSEAVMSAKFSLKKVPMIIYIGAGVVVVGVAAAVLLGGGDDDPGQNVNDPLPAPPEPGS